MEWRPDHPGSCCSERAAPSGRPSVTDAARARNPDDASGLPAARTHPQLRLHLVEEAPEAVPLRLRAAPRSAQRGPLRGQQLGQRAGVAGVVDLELFVNGEPDQLLVRQGALTADL